MEYLKKSFKVRMPTTSEYRDNWESIFGQNCEHSDAMCEECLKAKNSIANS